MPLRKSNFRSIDDESHAKAQRRGEIGVARSSLHPQRLCVSLFLIIISASLARADIFKWEYVNSLDPSQGKQQSTTLAPDGAGVDAVPGADLSNRNLTMAYLIGADLTGANGYLANLTNADLSQAHLANASFLQAMLTDADFTGAEIRGATFSPRPSSCSTFICPLGTGITVAQIYSTASYQADDLGGIGVSFHNLAGANFVRQNLTNATFAGATLDAANFSQAILTGAILSFAMLTDADFTGADLGNAGLNGANFLGATLTGANLAGSEVTGRARPLLGFVFRTSFASTTSNGFTAAQLYSTASYQAHDLFGINLSSDVLNGWNFAGQQLAAAEFDAATLAGANLSGAYVHGTVSWPGASLSSTTSNGFTAAQLYSTASYAAHDLTGIDLSHNDLSGWNFSGQNLNNVRFGGAKLTRADLTAADARGAVGLNASDATTANLILPDGHINGLSLGAGGLLVVREDRGDPYYYRTGREPIPIRVDQHFTVNPAGTLRIQLGPTPPLWHSTISFAPGIPVTLGGTLELTFAPDVNPASWWVGLTFDIFDWTGVNPTGAFAVSSPYAWDLSNLYTTGQITLTAIPEPAGAALAAAGVLSLTLYRRRKRP
jgi:uncharacterized protein YjbI with pentapeptide repeats